MKYSVRTVVIDAMAPGWSICTSAYAFASDLLWKT